MNEEIILRVLAVVIVFVIAASAQDTSMEKISTDLGLVPASKAIVQWERVFSSDRRMKKYNIDTLSIHLQDKLKVYLVQHAADSNQPMVPGL